MDELVKSLKVSLATVFTFYLKVHFFHWNVEGEDFYQYHKLFEKIYEDVYDSVDPMAEEVRALAKYVPGSLTRYIELSKVKDEIKVPTGAVMVERLLADNDTVIDCLNDTMEKAQSANEQGLMNFLADRLDKHKKWGWFLRSTQKGK